VEEERGGGRGTLEGGALPVLVHLPRHVLHDLAHDGGLVALLGNHRHALATTTIATQAKKEKKKKGKRK
jgi:hypothetical protein